MAKHIVFTLHVDSSNHAFQEDHAHEIARILKEVVAKLDAGKVVNRLHDVNGNFVGSATMYVSDV